MASITHKQSKHVFWPWWPLVPLYPYSQRRTIRQEVVPNTIWTFDQLQGIFYVVVPIRMTVVKLDRGGLLVYAPVAPVSECVSLMQELVAEHGEVKYIILPTVSGLEHKVFVGPFARRFPTARVYVAPEQWSFPINLPLSWLGFPGTKTQVLPKNSRETPFADEFDYEILGPINLRTGRFGEVALFHKRSRTLLVTDSVVSVPADPPDIVQLDPYPLLFHAKDSGASAIADTPENRRKGWQRITLFAFYFRPSVLDVMEWLEMLKDSRQASDRSRKAYFGLYPFQWQQGWQRSFDALRGDGRLFVAPVLQTLILNRDPQETLNWANQVALWQFERIIPCHLQSPIDATPQQFRQAFCFLEKYPAMTAGAFNPNANPLPENDFQILRDLDRELHRLGIVPPAKDKV